MKADGVEYEERMDLLDAVTYPKPLEDLLEAAYDIYRRGHPWVLRLRTVAEVGGPGHVRAGADVRRVRRRTTACPAPRGWCCGTWPTRTRRCAQTVPDEAKTEELADLIEWLGEIVRQVDSSLLDEWERLRNPSDPDTAEVDDAGRPGHRVTPGRSGCWCATRCSTAVKLAALGHYESWERWTRTDGWDAAAWEDALDAYFEVHDEIGTGPDARGPALLIIDEQPGRLDVCGRSSTTRRAIDDWGISAVVDLAASDEAGAAVFRITDVGQL